MKKKQIIGIAVAAVMFIITCTASMVITGLTDRLFGDASYELLTGEVEFYAPEQDYIAVVSVEGTIQEQTESGIFDSEQGYRHTTTMEYIDRLISDGHNKGMILYVDSPGGTVYESEELYDKLTEYKDTTGNPVWCYMAHYAASGGYMASVAADRIYANQNTTTGSIGVIMSGYDMSGLYEKLGIRYFSITSGVNKDSSQMTENQMEIYQTQVNECYERFVRKVQQGRKMEEEEVLRLADGRTYTAAQAKENGLIDEISSYDEMRTLMAEETGTGIFYEPSVKESFLSSLFEEAKSIIPKSEAQILKETAEETESGVLMYYAEQLR